MGAVCFTPTGYELTPGERKQCVALRNDSPELQQLRSSGILVRTGETVIQLLLLVNTRKKKETISAGSTTPLFAFNGLHISDAPPDQVERHRRAAIITRQGLLCIVVPANAFSRRKPFLEQFERGGSSLGIGLHEIRAVKYDTEKDALIIVWSKTSSPPPKTQNNKNQYKKHGKHSTDDDNGDNDIDAIMYQSAEPARLLQHLFEEVLSSHVGTPSWAIQLQWQLPPSLLSYITTQLPQDKTVASLRNDGGFSNAMVYHVNTIAIRNKVPPTFKATKIEQFISSKQEKQSQKSLDVTDLISKLGMSNNAQVVQNLAMAALTCLSFNLVFRSLHLNKIDIADDVTRSRFHDALGRTLLYNVTLRELDLSGTNLNGGGEVLGQALAMNIQPLLARIDISNCQLSNRDFRALVPGLARLWCGGSVEAISMNASHNPQVDARSWDLLWNILVDPKSFSSFWPTKPPPPPKLVFFQNLHLVGTRACFGDGLALGRFLEKLSGLKSVSLGPAPIKNEPSFMELIWNGLRASTAKLTEFESQGLGGSACFEALLPHSKTLTKITLRDYMGDAIPFLCGWPEAVPNLQVQFKKRQRDAYVLSPTSFGFSPGKLSIDKDSLGFLEDVITTLALSATGLKELYLYVPHENLAKAAPTLATCGLKVLHLNLAPKTRRTLDKDLAHQCEAFWHSMATSKTLEDLQVRNQLINERSDSFDGLDSIGRFLKVNRSVRNIAFDSDGLILKVDNVQSLRSAFYGNKKVISLQYPKRALERTKALHMKEYQACSQQVVQLKLQIKRLFKRAYSKYNPRWRDKPNREKLPLVERIRVAKRKMGKLDRDMKKMTKQLNEINVQVSSNFQNYNAQKLEKVVQKMQAKEEKFDGFANKKEKVVTKLVAKLHKAKARGRKNKAGKNQVPRHFYYKNKNLWPNATSRNNRNISSWWWAYNDPYGCRYPYWYGYYGHYYGYCHFPGRNDYLENNDYRPPVVEDQADDRNPDQDQGNDAQADQDGVEVGEEGDIIIPGDDGAVPVASGDISSLIGDGGTSLVVADTGGHWDVVRDDRDIVGGNNDLVDPWSEMDILVNSGLAGNIVDQDTLAAIHDEAQELGPDVVADIAPLLDQAAGLGAQMERTAFSLGVETSEVAARVDSNVVDRGFDVFQVQEGLGALPDYSPAEIVVVEEIEEIDGVRGVGEGVGDAEDFVDGDIEDVGDGDLGDIVDLYAGAGPRDLDDGGPSFGGNSPAARAVRSCRSPTKANFALWNSNIKLQKARERAAKKQFHGFQSLHLARDDVPLGAVKCFWPKNFQEAWSKEIKQGQMEVIANSGLLTTPETTEPRKLVDWEDKAASTKRSISVILVTQCSSDRLENLAAQLSLWKGEASVAVHVKMTEDLMTVEKAVMSCVGAAKKQAQESAGGCPDWNVCVTIVQSICPDSPYPINMLRNIALLQAKQHQAEHGLLLNGGAVFLVDVDFRPSNNLHSLLHQNKARTHIFDWGRAIVCPAFEIQINEILPTTTGELLEAVKAGWAEGFHTSHFPKGHGATNFERYWKSSSVSTASGWDNVYPVTHDEGFEPYIIMATSRVPLYDERFQGYGLNKVSHLFNVANQLGGTFHVLPGAFVVAPVHKRSDSWASVYGSKSDEANFNKLCLRALYKDFCSRLDDGKKPIVSSHTLSWNKEISKVAMAASLPESNPFAKTMVDITGLNNYQLGLFYWSLLKEIIEANDRKKKLMIAGENVLEEKNDLASSIITANSKLHD